MPWYSNLANFSLHFGVTLIAFYSSNLWGGSLYLCFITWWVYYSDHFGRRVKQSPQKNSLSGNFPSSISSVGRYLANLWECFTIGQMFFTAYSNHWCLIECLQISSCSKTFFSSQTIACKNPSLQYFFSGNHKFTKIFK